MRSPDTRSRRELLVLGAALGLASCGGAGKAKPPPTVSTTEAASDIALLGALLDQERSSIAAYTVIASKLRGGSLALARQILGQERAHAAALARAIGKLGGSPAPPRPEGQYASDFPALRGERDALSFALDVETTAVAAYSDSLAKIATDPVRATLATILTTESEHAAVALGELGRPQVPEPFVNGSPPQKETP